MKRTVIKMYCILYFLLLQKKIQICRATLTVSIFYFKRGSWTLDMSAKLKLIIYIFSYALFWFLIFQKFYLLPLLTVATWQQQKNMQEKKVNVFWNLNFQNTITINFPLNSINTFMLGNISNFQTSISKFSLQLWIFER